MKKEILYTLGVLLLFAGSFSSCNKELSVKKKSSDTTSTAGTVSTITNGSYSYIAADNSGNVYALRAYGADTIYKIDPSGSTSTFYVPATTMDNDTVVTHRLAFLTIDTLGNLYTVDYAGVSSVSVTEVGPTGTASTLYSNFIQANNATLQQIAVNQGNFYYGDYLGIHKIAAGGSQSLLATNNFSIFTINKDGVIYYPTQNPSGQFDIVQLSTGGNKVVIAGPDRTDDLNGAKDVVFDPVVDLTTDRHNNIVIAEGSSEKATIHVISSAGKVVELISTPFGHKDGPLSTAVIGVPFSIVTDASSNLYFSELTVDPADIRKITF